MNLILFGFKGSGKTHFGKLLALKLHRPFIDTDDLVSELYAGQSGKRWRAREIFAKIGNDPFRQLEREALKTLLNVKDAVIAVGGGTVLDPENVELLQKIGQLVYLETGMEALKMRLLKDELPAILDPNDPEGSLARMIRERKPIYESIRARKVKTDALDEAGVIAALSSILVLEEPTDGF